MSGGAGPVVHTHPSNLWLLPEQSWKILPPSSPQPSLSDLCPLHTLPARQEQDMQGQETVCLLTFQLSINCLFGSIHPFGVIIKISGILSLSWLFLAASRQCLKGIFHFFLEICSFYNSPRVKLLTFTFFESIQPISGSGVTTLSIA